MQNTKGKLYLLPTVLAEESTDSIPASVVSVVEMTNYYIVENLKTARRYIKLLLKSKNLDSCVFEELDKHADYGFKEEFLQHALNGRDIALLSEAGMPCLADPGHKVVARAHEMSIDVVPLAGPSSILLALVASGLNGQHFTFNGYLPIEAGDRRAKLQQMEAATRKGYTQIFMDTPYRNQKVLEEIIQVCSHATRLCIACELTGKNEFIRTLPVSAWKIQKVDLHKKPAVFILGQ